MVPFFGCAASVAVWAFSSFGEWGYSRVAVCRLLTVAAPLAAEHRLSGMRTSVVVAHGLRSCGSETLEHRLNVCDAGA